LRHPGIRRKANPQTMNATTIAGDETAANTTCPLPGNVLGAPPRLNSKMKGQVWRSCDSGCGERRGVPREADRLAARGPRGVPGQGGLVITPSCPPPAEGISAVRPRPRGTYSPPFRRPSALSR
jgi:hypothetical protein